MNGLVSFIGAGPGDPDLITVKALRRLREAEVVIHDRLVPAALLDEVPAAAEIIDVGKAPRRHCISPSRERPWRAQIRSTFGLQEARSPPSACPASGSP